MLKIKDNKTYIIPQVPIPASMNSLLTFVIGLGIKVTLSIWKSITNYLETLIGKWKIFCTCNNILVFRGTLGGGDVDPHPPFQFLFYKEKVKKYPKIVLITPRSYERQYWEHYFPNHFINNSSSPFWWSYILLLG